MPDAHMPEKFNLQLELLEWQVMGKTLEPVTLTSV